MVRSYRAISPKLEEAAELEGASIGHSFARVVLPLAACALIVTGLFSVVLAWIEYVIAGLLLRTTGMFPLPVAPTGGASVSDAVVSLVATGAVTLFFLLSRLLTIRSIGSEVDL
jgi:ABC-type glycerol-3-phosphate transport system permease component